MLNWEINNAPFDGDIADEKIVCKRCHWSWKVKDGGDDLFVCHKCNYDNSSYYQKSNFEGDLSSGGSTNWGNVISSSLETGSKYIPQSGSRLNEDAKQSIALKKEAEAKKKTVKAECGRNPWLGKKKNQAYEECRKRVIDKLEAKSQELKTQRESENILKQKSLLQSQKTRRNQTYVVAGVIIFAIVGFIVYKKMSK